MATNERWQAVQQGQQLPTILLVEDDPLIQGVIEDALSEGGFKVALVSSSEDAIPLLQSEPSCGALVTDIHLAGAINGWELARMAREIHALLPVVYMTGEAAEEWPSQGVPNSILLTKPFAPAQLVTAVSQLLNANSSAPSQ
jgi:DNA-binding response OmpR family regulator